MYGIQKNGTDEPICRAGIETQTTDLQTQWGKVNIEDFGEGGVQCSQVLTLQKVFCQSRGADVIMKGFSDFLDKKRCKDWNHEISS